MSTDNPTATTQQTGDEQTIEDRLDALEAANQRLRAENEALRERVDTVETQLEEMATIEWDEPDPHAMKVVEADGRNRIRFFSLFADDIDELEARLDDVEEGRADVVVRSEAEDALPIESSVARQRAGNSLPADEARAAVVFPRAAAKARVVGGSRLVLASDDVREILVERTDRAEWSRELVRRAMREMCRLTSSKPEGRRTPDDPEGNLWSMGKRNGHLTMEASLDEVQEWADEASGGDE